MWSKTVAGRDKLYLSQTPMEGAAVPRGRHEAEIREKGVKNLKEMQGTRCPVVLVKR